MPGKETTSSNSLRNRILIMTLSFTILISFIITAILSFIYTNYLRNSLLQSTERNLQFLTDTINRNMDNVIRIIRWSQNNSTISAYVESQNEDVALQLRAFNRLSEEYQNNDAKGYIHRIVISNSTTKRFIQIVPSTYSSVIDIADYAPQLEYFDSLYANKNFDYSVGFVDDPFYTGRTKLVLPLIRPIFNRYNASHDGWVFAEVTEQLFTDTLQYYSMASDSSLYLSLGSHIYQMKESGLTEIHDSFTIENSLEHYTLLEGCTANYIKNETTGDSFWVITKELSMDGCYISQTISPRELNSQQSLFLLFAIIIILLICCLGIGLTYLLFRTISIPVRKLQKKLSSVSQGDFSRDPQIEWQHELGDIGRGINDLSDNVLKLMERRVEDEKQKKDLEYKMLQSQINPHFLYNTLNSIKWMATIQGADGISEMTTALARLMKSISKGTSLLIPLQEELSLVQDYFTIQQYRYGGTISLTVEISVEQLYQCQIVKFTLQPLVENAIFHGIEPKAAAGVIRITASYTEERDVLIIVEDDGIGMPEDMPAKLLAGKTESKSDFFKEIGINNVNQRLQYQFGQQYGISIETEEGVFTRMRILIPYTAEQ
ncbi:MAG: sensor histidine kinase [Lachnospiraceae bacterium]|nr:sensor histidine kinase [Lachnospiraceae bacterium]